MELNNLHEARFNHFSILMTSQDAHSASHQGKCDEDVQALLQRDYIKTQLAEIDSQDLIEELSEYGEWSAEELSSREDNEQRIIWLAAGNIVEEYQS